MTTGRILIIEDTATMAALYVKYLETKKYAADVAENGRNGLTLISKNAYDAIVLDLNLPDMNGMEILKHVKQHFAHIPVIVITAYGSIGTAVDAMRIGAFDFIMKPFASARLNATVDLALEHNKLKTELTELRRTLYQEGYHKIIGTSPVMQAVFRQIDAVAPSKASVFISGESGTGKELVAEAIHRSSPRSAHHFIALNCAAIPKDLLESEIFGHVRGAFTGADVSRRGAAALADGGTLFLDEICEMDMNLQAKILRFIQTGTYSPVGTSEMERADIRFICATNRNALAEVEAGRMREDLYYRLHVIPLELPPLRDREDDILEIATSFLKRFSLEERKAFTRFDDDVVKIFRTYDWPGNVRQLENLIRQVVVMNQGEAVTLAMLPENFKKEKTLISVHRGAEHNQLVKPLWQVEKDTVMRALKASQNDIPRAAALLEVSPSTIYRKLQAWKLENPQAGDDSVTQMATA